jgi:hypothetical protein
VIVDGVSNVSKACSWTSDLRLNQVRFNKTASVELQISLLPLSDSFIVWFDMIEEKVITHSLKMELWESR